MWAIIFLIFSVAGTLASLFTFDGSGQSVFNVCIWMFNLAAASYFVWDNNR